MTNDLIEAVVNKEFNQLAERHAKEMEMMMRKVRILRSLPPYASAYRLPLTIFNHVKPCLVWSKSRYDSLRGEPGPLEITVPFLSDMLEHSITNRMSIIRDEPKTSAVRPRRDGDKDESCEAIAPVYIRLCGLGGSYSLEVRWESELTLIDNQGKEIKTLCDMWMEWPTVREISPALSERIGCTFDPYKTNNSGRAYVLSCSLSNMPIGTSYLRYSNGRGELRDMVIVADNNKASLIALLDLIGVHAEAAGRIWDRAQEWSGHAKD